MLKLCAAFLFPSQLPSSQDADCHSYSASSYIFMWELLTKTDVVCIFFLLRFLPQLSLSSRVRDLSWLQRRLPNGSDERIRQGHRPWSCNFGGGDSSCESVLSLDGWGLEASEHKKAEGQVWLDWLSRDLNLPKNAFFEANWLRQLQKAGGFRWIQ